MTKNKPGPNASSMDKRRAFPLLVQRAKAPPVDSSQASDTEAPIQDRHDVPLAERDAYYERLAKELAAYPVGRDETAVKIPPIYPRTKGFVLINDGVAYGERVTETRLYMTGASPLGAGAPLEGHFVTMDSVLTRTGKVPGFVHGKASLHRGHAFSPTVPPPTTLRSGSKSSRARAESRVEDPDDGSQP